MNTVGMKNCEETGEHELGPVEISRMAGNPHRKCKYCRFVSLDLEGESDGHI